MSSMLDRVELFFNIPRGEISILIEYTNKIKNSLIFLALTGALGVTLWVCLSICLSSLNCSRALILLISGSNLQADFRMTLA